MPCIYKWFIEQYEVYVFRPGLPTEEFLAIHCSQLHRLNPKGTLTLLRRLINVATPPDVVL